MTAKFYMSYDEHLIINANALDMRKINTRQLLMLLKRWRLHSDTMCTKIKAELANRPHIPNKLEGKRLRREAAKRGR